MGSQSCEMREGGSQQNHKHTSRRGEFKEQGEAEEVRLYLLYLASLSLPPSMESMSQSIWRSALPRTASKSADLGSGTQCHRSSGCRHRCTQPQLVHTGESHSERVSPWVNSDRAFLTPHATCEAIQDFTNIEHLHGHFSLPLCGIFLETGSSVFRVHSPVWPPFTSQNLHQGQGKGREPSLLP
jgi:hypothetical protein